MMKTLNICLGLSLLLATGARAADNVYLTLKNGNTQIKGESSVTTQGRQDAIECYSYEQNVETTNNQRRYEPLVIVKRIDKSSPLLMKAMVENQTLSAVFKFFRPASTGAGATQQFYTVTLTNARILSVSQVVPDTRDKNAPVSAPLEEVKFGFSGIEWTYTDGGVSSGDNAVQMTGTTTPVRIRPFQRIPN